MHKYVQTRTEKLRLKAAQAGPIWAVSVGILHLKVMDVDELFHNFISKFHTLRILDPSRSYWCLFAGVCCILLFQSFGSGSLSNSCLQDAKKAEEEGKAAGE